MQKILIIGAAYVDVIVDVPQLPTTGTDVRGNLQSYRVGGSAFNVYGATTHCHAPADLLVPIGTGHYANLVRDYFYQHQIPVKLSVKAGDNGWNLSMVEPNGERSFLTIPGVDQHWSLDWFYNTNLSEYKYIYLSGYELAEQATADVLLTILARRSVESFLLFDASPWISRLSPRTIDQLLTDHVVVHGNATEIQLLVPDQPTLEQQAAAIFHRTHSPVIVTLGARGTYYYDGRHAKIIPAVSTTVVNTIGAGDTHCGGLMDHLLAGDSLPEAIQHANQLAAQIVARSTGSLLTE